MKHLQNILNAIRARQALLLSVLIHLLIIIIFIHTTYYIPKLREERAAASILFKDDGGRADRMKYQDKSLVDRTRKREDILYPHPEVEHFPDIPKIDFQLDPSLRQELDLIRVDTMDRSFSNFAVNRQPYFTGEQELAGAFAKHIKRMRKKGLDIVFVFDSTGSMGLYVEHVKKKIRSLVRAIRKLVPAARVGLVTYRDVGMDFVTRAVQLTHGTRGLELFLEETDYEGGGDREEAVYEGLKIAIEDLNWKKKSAKVIVLIGDAPPHSADMGKATALVEKFRDEMGGTLATVDTNRPIPLAGQYHGCPAGVEPPCDVVLHGELMREFRIFAEKGGGECLRFNDMEKMNEMMVMLIFGSDWKDYLDVFIKNL
jgi:Mg-chelatase subunit ChlD